MRVLIVNAYPASSKRGQERFEQFRRHVIGVVREMQKGEATRVEIIERHRSALDMFLFEVHSEFTDPHNITNFDQVDFVFVDGDSNSSPWAPNMRKLALLTKMCMMTGKCYYGSGIGAVLVAFVCSTGGEYFRVMNNEGKGSLIDDLREVPPPSRATLMAGFVSPSSYDRDVLLDIKTGDFFAFSEQDCSWQPKGNTGLVLHSSDSARSYGTRPNSARAGSKRTNVGQISQPLFLAKRGELRSCVRLEVAHQHPVIISTFPRQREIVLNSKSKWDLDEVIASTGGNKYRVLIDSSRGPMLLEFGNCFGSHFEIGSEYPETLALLRNFTLAKYDELKVHAHIDRSYVSAISGSSRLKQRLTLAQNKQVRSTQAPPTEPKLHDNTRKHLVDGKEGVGIGRTSPKRCRPVSAGPYRSAPHPAISRRIRTSRSAYPSQMTARSSDGDTCGILGQSKVIADLSARNEGYDNNNSNEKQERPETEEYPPSTVECQTKSSRIVRVLQKNELEKPYCAQERFDKMRSEESKLLSKYYSIVNDAPYQSSLERETIENQKSKMKWLGGPFRSVIGKASTQVAPGTSVFIEDPFEEKNTPYYVTQRQQLDVRSRRRRQQK